MLRLQARLDRPRSTQLRCCGALVTVRRPAASLIPAVRRQKPVGSTRPQAVIPGALEKLARPTCELQVSGDKSRSLYGSAWTLN